MKNRLNQRKFFITHCFISKETPCPSKQRVYNNNISILRNVWVLVCLERIEVPDWRRILCFVKEAVSSAMSTSLILEFAALDFVTNTKVINYRCYLFIMHPNSLSHNSPVPGCCLTSLKRLVPCFELTAQQLTLKQPT